VTFAIIAFMKKNIIDPNSLAQTTEFGFFILGDIRWKK
jgi:hypothetical protein